MNEPPFNTPMNEPPFNTPMNEPPLYYKYDLFIYYVEADKDWVNGFLLPALDSHKVRYIHEENFSLGKPTVSLIEDATKESSKVLLVISSACLNNDWIEFVRLLAQSHGIKEKQWTLIPLFKEKVVLPSSITTLELESLDASVPSKWMQAVERLCKYLNHSKFEPPLKLKCPYPGMKTFNEEDSENFWGRNNDIDRMLRQLDKCPFLAVIGSSGSGKSSLVFAGLIPALKKSARFPGRWIMKTMRPGNTPVKTLERILGGSSKELDATVKSFFVKEPSVQRLLIIVDQFEEIFTIVKEKKESQDFQQVLSQLIQIKNCYLVLTIRADFYQDLIGLQPLWKNIQENRYEIEHLTKDGLKNAILNPGKNVGVYIDSILVERLVGDFSGAKEPGILPFFQVTLRSLWEKLEYKYLPLHAYEKQGLDKIIEEFAQEAWSALPIKQQEIARRIFLRLVQFGEGRVHTRRQQLVSELQIGNNEKEFKTVLDHFLNDKYRLLTISNIAREENELEKTVDLAHEILITSWPIFQEWISQYREAEKERRWLEKKAQEWNLQSKRIGGLLNSDDLKKAKKWSGNSYADHLGYSNELTILINRSEWMIWWRRFMGLMLIIVVVMTWFARQQAARDKIIKKTVLKDITPDLVRQLSRRLPDFQKIGKNAKNSRNFENALENYQFLVKLKLIESEIEFSGNPDDFLELKSEREQIRKVAKKSEKFLAEVISLARIPALEEQLKAGNFGGLQPPEADSEIEGEFHGVAARDKQFTGALKTTYRIIMMGYGANADYNKDGYFTDGEEELIPCSTLEELEQLWRKYTQNRCGWYGENSDREAPHCKELGGKTLTIMLFYGIATPEFKERLSTQCQVVKIPKIGIESAE